MKFMTGEPVLISTSEAGNSVKMWLFEKGQVVPRLLRQRSGHSDTPLKIQFYGGYDDPVMHGARNIISCARDGTLRDISLYNEFQSMDFSVKNLTKGRIRSQNGDGRVG